MGAISPGREGNLNINQRAFLLMAINIPQGFYIDIFQRKVLSLIEVRVHRRLWIRRIKDVRKSQRMTNLVQSDGSDMEIVQILHRSPRIETVKADNSTIFA